MTLSSGAILEGYFKDGQLCGIGRLKIDGVLIEGNFERGQLRPGKMTTSDGSVFEGNLDMKGVLHGKGKVKLANGALIEGNFEHNFLQGMGKITFADGSSNEGNFDNHLLQGKGKIRFADGVSIEGNFERGNLHGKAKRLLANGSVSIENYFHGALQNGELTTPLPNGCSVRTPMVSNGELHGVAVLVCKGIERARAMTAHNIPSSALLAAVHQYASTEHDGDLFNIVNLLERVRLSSESTASSLPSTSVAVRRPNAVRDSYRKAPPGAGCNSYSDCADGASCDHGICTSSGKAPPGAGCNSYSDCADGASCNHGICTK